MPYLKILAEHYPNDQRVVSNAGTILSHMGELDEGLRYLKKAEGMDPKDTITLWNIGRVYDLTERVVEAKAYYDKAFSLETDEARKKANACMYAALLAGPGFGQGEDKARACELQTKYCEGKSACEGATLPNTPAP